GDVDVVVDRLGLLLRGLRLRGLLGRGDVEVVDRLGLLLRGLGVLLRRLRVGLLLGVLLRGGRVDIVVLLGRLRVGLLLRGLRRLGLGLRLRVGGSLGRLGALRRRLGQRIFVVVGLRAGVRGRRQREQDRQPL